MYLFLTLLALSSNTQAANGLPGEENPEENITCGRATCRSHCSLLKQQADDSYKLARKQMLHASGIILTGGLCGFLAKGRPLLRWTTITVALTTGIPGVKRSWGHYNLSRILSSTLDRN